MSIITTGIFLAAEGQSEGNFLVSMMPFALIFLVFYFLLIRPQQKEQKKRKDMLNTVQTGTKVITVGGLYGEITNVSEQYVLIRVADKTILKVTRASIGQILTGDSGENPSQEKKS